MGTPSNVSLVLETHDVVLELNSVLHHHGSSVMSLMMSFQALIAVLADWFIPWTSVETTDN